MTRESSLNLALLKFLLDAKVEPEEAARRAWEFAKKAAKARTLRPVWWFAQGSDDDALELTAGQANDIPEDQLRDLFDVREGHIIGDDDGLDADAKEFGRLVSRARLVRIPMAEIVRHIDRLFRDR